MALNNSRFVKKLIVKLINKKKKRYNLAVFLLTKEYSVQKKKKMKVTFSFW